MLRTTAASRPPAALDSLLPRRRPLAGARRNPSHQHAPLRRLAMRLSRATELFSGRPSRMLRTNRREEPFRPAPPDGGAWVGTKGTDNELMLGIGIKEDSRDSAQGCCCGGRAPLCRKPSTFGYGWACVGVGPRSPPIGSHFRIWPARAPLLGPLNRRFWFGSRARSGGRLAASVARRRIAHTRQVHHQGARASSSILSIAWTRPGRTNRSLARRHAHARSTSRPANPLQRHGIAGAERRSARALAGKIVLTADHQAIKPLRARAAWRTTQVATAHRRIGLPTRARRRKRRLRRRHDRSAVLDAIHARVTLFARRAVGFAPAGAHGAALPGGAPVAVDQHRYPARRARGDDGL
jgi:hypothetical protein